MKSSEYSVFSYFIEQNINYLVFDHFLSDKKDCFYVLIKDRFAFAIETLKKDFKVQKDICPCLYGMESVYVIADENCLYYFFERPAIRSLNEMEWCPFNKNIEKVFWENNEMDGDIKVLSKSNRCFYLFCKNLFNNRGQFELNEMKEIKQLKGSLISSPHCKMLFESTFYKCSNLILSSLNLEDFSNIFDKYISFKEY